MKCPNCGAESNGSFCSFCGSKMPEQQPNISITNNYYGSNSPNVSNPGVNAVTILCPKCGSDKISFQRESSGTRGYHKTVGMCKNCGHTWITAQDAQPLYTDYHAASPRNKWVALVLCIFLGYFGVHQFYVGRKGLGWIYLFTVGLFGLGWMVDIVLIATGKFKDAQGRLLL
ncbi:NINE protein [Butyrivibrio sp. AC2005]|uniref:NINE protein n=1 Tax=Butyrivibrio sp. AC2005 TaxID=1280672 RepID=UPI001FA6FFB1|nr:NINE protein [Butyrivibrio sp. AC2005]